jgi:hypothetical protein
MIFHAKRHDPRRAPADPEGFPEEIWTYHWFSENKGWTPQQVDELTLEQQFWLPIMKNADGIANSQLSDD